MTGISSETVALLESKGIKDTLTLFDKVKTQTDREILSRDTGIRPEEIMLLTKLTDLSRIRWVGCTFARVLYEAGFETTTSVAEADYQYLYNTILRLNSEKNLYKGQIGLNDMKLCVLSAREVSSEIEY
ncbi:MAG: DUF4332 domain-containing protein [Bacteroidales bacterium]|nr:DUF4332 domain-containing protein [Bacteroidales bacterium]